MSTVSVRDIIRIQCSGLYNSTDLNTYIILATQQTSQSFFGINYNLAIALRACHMYTLNNSNGINVGSGPIKSIKEGDLSISYGSISGMNSSSDLQLTSYGIRLKGLIDAGPGAIRVLGVDESTIGENNE